MNAERRKRGLLAAAILLTIAGAAVIVAVFSLMSRTEHMTVYLWENASERRGWSYEVLSDGKVTPAEPVFPDEWSAYLPAEAAEAVRMRLTMTDDMRNDREEVVWPTLVVEPYDCRVEVFLNDRLLATDVEAGAERDENGFLRLSQAERDAMAPKYRAVSATLPEDYLGGTLTIIAYYAEPRQDPQPMYPMLSTDSTQYAPYVASAVPETVRLTICAILTLLILVVFLLDVCNGTPDGRMLLLALYFLMMFFDTAYNSTAGPVSILYEKLDLSFLNDLYMVPMYLYLALQFTGWKRIALSVSVAVWRWRRGPTCTWRCAGAICSWR